MQSRLNVMHLILMFLVVGLLIAVFNLWATNHDLKQKNANLSNNVEKYKAYEDEEKEVFTQTEQFLTDTLQGGSIDYFTKRYRKEVEQTLTENETSKDVDISEMKDLEIYNISVRKQDDTYRVYAIYKVTLTGIDEEFVNPGDQPVLILTSKITWINENGELKVDAHDLESFTSGEQAIQEISS
ncbi:hypothetical protein [Paenisporosarcina sp. NPDC076898]|uniref:hypothetical protein n=1 Tax=unclassified Paenisporosarcina TaxID=2642018 RepID=UPI003D0951CC